jgi:tetrahydromethanopterin S-methyltransferase subunit E
LPQSVTDDICSATSEVESILALASAINGILTFTAETYKDVVFVTPLTNTNYRVQLSPSIFAPLRITNKTITGFTVQAGATITGQVGYDVFI